MKKLLKKKKFKELLIYGLVIVLTVILLAIFSTALRSFVFSSILFIAGCLSSQFRRLTGKIDVGISFIPFATIIFIYTRGIIFSIIICAIMLIISSLLIGDFQLDIIIYLVVVSIVALFSLFLNFEFVMNAIILIILFNVIALIILIIMGFDLAKNLIYFFGSIAFNYILINFFGKLFMTLIG